MSTSISIGAGLPHAVSLSGCLPIFCGPCVIESRESAREHCARIVEIAAQVGVQLVYKSSFDKANRTSAAGYRGVGIEEGLQILGELRKEFGVPVIIDVHSPSDAALAGVVVDVVQVPAFLSRQTDLLVASGATQKPVLVKKGQFLHPLDMQFAVEKIHSSGNTSVMVCERGTSFGYRELIVDYRASRHLQQLHEEPAASSRRFPAPKNHAENA